MSKTDTTLNADDFDVEYYHSAEKLITAACYLADKSTGRKLREHWQGEFKKLLTEHEKNFPKAHT